MCSAPAFCAWRLQPLIICLKLLVGVCVRVGLAASVCVYAALLLFPLSDYLFLGVGAPSLSLGSFMFLGDRRGSLFVAASGSAACVLASFSLALTILFHPPSCVLGLLRRCLCCAEPSPFTCCFLRLRCLLLVASAASFYKRTLPRKFRFGHPVSREK